MNWQLEKDNKKKILILGSMPDFEALTKTCNDCGYETIVCDAYKEGPAKKIASKYYDVDVFDLETLVAICKENNVKGVVTGFSDLLMEAYVALCERMSFKSYLSKTQLAMMRNKVFMKQCLEKYNVPTMPCQIIDSLHQVDIKKVKFPAVIKPVDGYGSRGVYCVHTEEELQLYLEASLAMSKHHQVLIEPFHKGKEYNFFAWVKNRKGYLIYICNREKVKFSKNHIALPYNFVYPAQIYDELLPKVNQRILQLIEAYDIQDGPLAVQSFYDGHEIVINEATMRFLGNGDHRVAFFANHVRAEELLIAYAMENEYEVSVNQFFHNYKTKFNKILVELQLYAKNGKINAIEGLEWVKQQLNTCHIELYYKIQDTIYNQGGQMVSVGTIFFTVSDYKQIPAENLKLTTHLKLLNEKGENLLYPLGDTSLQYV